MPVVNRGGWRERLCDSTLVQDFMARILLREAGVQSIQLSKHPNRIGQQMNEDLGQRWTEVIVATWIMQCPKMMGSLTITRHLLQRQCGRDKHRSLAIAVVYTLKL